MSLAPRPGTDRCTSQGWPTGQSPVVWRAVGFGGGVFACLLAYCSAKTITTAITAAVATIAVASFSPRRRPEHVSSLVAERRWGGVVRHRRASVETANAPADVLPDSTNAWLVSHDPGLEYELAPLRNAATAAGLLMLKSWPMEFVESNQTKPSSPYR